MTTDRIKQQKQDIKNGCKLAVASTRKERRQSVKNADYKSDRANVALSIKKAKPVNGLSKAIATVSVNGIGQLVKYKYRIDLKLRATYRGYDIKANMRFNAIATKNMIVDLGKIDRYTILNWLADPSVRIGNGILTLNDLCLLYDLPLHQVISRIRYALILITKDLNDNVKSIHSLPLSIDV
jgi:hypothetical protein